MNRCNSIKRTPTIDALPLLVKPQRGGSYVSSTTLGSFSSPRTSSPQSQNLLKVFSPESRRHVSARTRAHEPFIEAIANTETKECVEFSGLGTPLKPSSPEGKFLSAILQTQRHFFEFAVSEQLDELACDRDEAAARKNQSSGSMESVLHGRIAEMKEKECQTAIEDLIYMSIVHKFSEVEVPMVPKLTKCITNNKLDIWPSKHRELESIHSPEVQEMTREHLNNVLSMREKSTTIDGATITMIDRLRLGRIYAASIMYGYFLKSACFRRQLDISLAGSNENKHENYLPAAAAVPTSEFPSHVGDESIEALVNSLCQEPRRYDTIHESLRSYVSRFDSPSLQRCAKLKSKEAVNVIERHTWALFVDENTGSIDPDMDIVITFPSLERLVLEAIAFGSFLWDVERSVDLAYGLKEI